MLSNSEITRLIFGLKVRQLRLDKGIPALEVAKTAGLSPSYFNEIEKGKKYPKVEKIFDLARALDTDYETLVSPRLSQRLSPLAELLHSPIFNELPFEWLGLDIADLLELLWDAPARVSAFINTIIEISRSYGMKVEGFFFSVLRTYQEIHDNYFPELENAADAFRQQVSVDDPTSFTNERLSQLLIHQYGYQIEPFEASQHPEFARLRSVFFPNNNKKLLLNVALSPQQQAFTLARELGFQHLHFTNRSLISSVLEAESFEQVLNNFQASYFANALLMPREQMIARLEAFFALDTWQPARMLALLHDFGATPEMFMHRISGLLATHFGLNDLFFLRLNNRIGEKDYFLSKEMHLSRLHSPHTTIDEHYCRRWASIRAIEELVELQTSQTWDGEPLIRAQFSDYYESPEQYLVLAIACPSPPQQGINSSLSLGIALNESTRKIIRFADDPAITRRLVNQTCERCGILDCLERVAEPKIYRKQVHLEKIRDKYKELAGKR